MTRQECNPTLEKMGAALVELMRDLPFDKITVDQITKKAGTGRITDAGQEAAIFMAYKYSFLEEASGNSEEVIRNALLDYGLFGVIHEWIRMGCDPPAAEMVDRVLSLINLRR